MVHVLSVGAYCISVGEVTLGVYAGCIKLDTGYIKKLVPFKSVGPTFDEKRDKR
jgi:hypothetical protein